VSSPHFKKNKKLTLKELFEEDRLKLYSPKREIEDLIEDTPIYAPARSPYPFDDGTILVNHYFNKNLHREDGLRQVPETSMGLQEEKNLFSPDSESAKSTANFILIFFRTSGRLLEELIQNLLTKLGAN